MIRTALVVVAVACVPTLAAAQQQPQSPAPESMSRQQLREEVTRLRAITGNRAVLPQRPAGCSSAESRQFDFWLGEWDVSPTGSSVVIAESSIASHDQGCVMIEEWRPFGSGHGHSINSYDASEQKWRQTWMDANGRRAEYAGTFQDGVMYLDNIGGNAPGAVAGQRARMNYQRIDENTVRQWGENFDAAQNAWVVAWDLTYRRRPGER